jgi:DNA (cytosine-5)-methyltransferase 1
MGKVLIKQQVLGENRGKKRIWMEGLDLAEFGFVAGARYGRSVREGVITLQVSEGGSHKVSKKQKLGAEIPVIDILNEKIQEIIGACEAIRIVYRDKTIVIRASELDGRIKSREQAVIDAVTTGTPLNWGSCYHGAGVLDSGLHEGFDLGNLDTCVKVAVEIDEDYLAISRRNNTFWADAPIQISSPMELMMLGIKSEPMELNGVSMGIPCTGASKSGRSKNKLQFAEDHDKAGAQIFYALDFIKRTNPAFVIIENVVEYSSTASWSIAKGVLDMLGYVIHYREFSGAEFGALEDRRRMVALAISKGLNDLLGFDMDAVVPRNTKPASLGDIMDNVPLDSTAWKPFDYLKTKEVRDIEAGKGFRLQWLDETAETIGTIGRGYFKARSTEPFIKHPTDDELARLLTPAEHARAKTIPVTLIDGVTSATMAHEVLGQSVVREWFVCLGRTLAERLVESLISVNSKQKRYCSDVKMLTAVAV